jgi:hypothetical protein
LAKKFKRSFYAILRNEDLPSFSSLFTPIPPWFYLDVSNNLDEMIRLPLPWTLSPKLSFELFIYVENDWADGAIREGLIHPEDKVSLAQMRKRTAVARPIIVDRAEIILQKRTWLVSEN